MSQVPPHGTSSKDAENTELVNQLLQAVNGNDFIGMKWLLEDNKCKSLLDQQQWTLLMTATRAAHVDLLDVLISSGAGVNLHCAESGLTALMHAASQGSLDVVSKLQCSGMHILMLKTVKDIRPL